MRQDAAARPFERGDDALSRLARALAPNALLVVCVSAFSTALVWRLSGQVNQDAWLAFASGREILQHGLPHSETLTVWGGGRSWVDQQWLAQLAFYGLAVSGGLALAAFAHALLATSAYAGAVAIARRSGASARSVLYLLPPALWLLIGSTWQVRTQSFAYPLFVLVLWLLAADSRRPSRRVLLVLPLLVLWANLHGSVAIGVALCVVRGGVELVRRRRSAALVLVAAPLALLATPYGLATVGYYRDTMFNSAFSTMLNEWEPLSLGLDTLPFFALAAFVVWLLGRARGMLTGFEELALVATCASALSATRNTVWFALAVIALAPRAVDRAFPPSDRSAALGKDVALAAAAVVVLVAAGISTLVRPDAWFARDFPPVAASRAVAVAHGRPIFADVKYADWLLWQDPDLRGRIAFDARFELLPVRRIYEIYNLDNPYGRAWAAPTRGFRVLVLDSRLNAVPIKQILAAGGARVVSRDAAVTVLAR